MEARYLILSLIPLMLLLYGCPIENDLAGKSVDTTKQIAEDQDKEDGTENEEQSEIPSREESLQNPPVAEEATPEDGGDECGDGSCSSGETCFNCVKDCGCNSTSACVNGACKTAECLSETDCADSNPCTVDRCNFAPHPNAFCSHDLISKPRNNDGCCPFGASVNTDTDCIPVCGDDRCQFGETNRVCPEDCHGSDGTTSTAPTGGSRLG